MPKTIRIAFIARRGAWPSGKSYWPSVQRAQAVGGHRGWAEEIDGVSNVGVQGRFATVSPSRLRAGAIAARGVRAQPSPAFEAPPAGAPPASPGAWVYGAPASTSGAPVPGAFAYSQEGDARTLSVRLATGFSTFTALPRAPAQGVAPHGSWADGARERAASKLGAVADPLDERAECRDERADFGASRLLVTALKKQFEESAAAQSAVATVASRSDAKAVISAGLVARRAVALGDALAAGAVGLHQQRRNVREAVQAETTQTPPKAGAPRQGSKPAKCRTALAWLVRAAQIWMRRGTWDVH